MSYRQLYEGILASIPASVLLLDRQLHVVSANRNFLEKSHRSAESTLGREVAEVFPPVLLSYTHLIDRVRQVFDTGRAEDGGEMTYRAPGLPAGVYFYRLTPIYEEHGRQVANVMLLMEDITERVRLGEEVRRVERHLASVVECANEAVVSMTSTGMIKTWNSTAEMLSGFRRDEVQGRSLTSLCAPKDQAAMQTILQEMQKAVKTHASVELSLLTKTKAEVPIAWSLSSMRDDAGQVSGLVAVGRDLTEHRRLEAQLIQSAKMVSLGVMAGGIAHEIRNPLGICSAAAQLLQEHLGDPQLIQEATQKIYIAVRRASDIIENLQKFVRPSTDGRMALLNVNTILEDTLALMANETRAHQIEVRQHPTEALPQVMSNASLLQQVFTNLILNAIAAMPAGGQLHVVTQMGEDQILIHFTDTGRGIAPQHLNQIFDPFFTTMPVGKGMGLGLSISYAIVQQFGGRITTESRVGQGSTFTVCLPIAEKTDDE